MLEAAVRKLMGRGFFAAFGQKLHAPVACNPKLN